MLPLDGGHFITEVTLPIRNKVVDLDQVDYVLLPDGTKLPATNTR